MDVQAVNNYFEDIARRLIPISHEQDGKIRFVGIDSEKVNELSNSKLDYKNSFCLLMVDYDGYLSATNDDQVKDRNGLSFVILKHVKKHDFPAKELVYKESKQIGMQVIAQLQADKEKRFQGQASPIKDFELNSVRYANMGPMFDNAYGTLFEFEIPEPIAIIKDPALWNE